MNRSDNNYDIENRLKNILWTVSGDYAGELDDYEKYSRLSGDLAVYSAAKAGARRKYIDWKAVQAYLNYKIKKGARPDIIIPLAQLCCDQVAEVPLLQERPGMAEIRQSAYQDLIKEYLLAKNKSLLEQVGFAILLRQAGKSVQMAKTVREVVLAVEKKTDSADAGSVIKRTEAIYAEYFAGIDESADINEPEHQNADKLFPESGQIQQESFSDFMLEEYCGSGFTFPEPEHPAHSQDPKPDRKEDILISGDEDAAEKLFAKIQGYYGKSFLSKEELQRIEKKICRGPHEGCRVHFTDGALRGNDSISFQTKYVARQKENNQAFYNINSRVNRKNLHGLRESLNRLLAKEEEITSAASEYGILVPSRLWKIGRTNDNKVFRKIRKDQKGGYAVDILLDGSGSQKDRQGQVASQGYILAQALTLTGIPNRVMSFSSFLDFTILRRFRDYNSPEKENKNIFEYQAAGNNRDGLAIRAACEGLYQRDEENRILIVLSDGKPNDLKIAKTSAIRGEISYRGLAAVKDTALEIRRARNNGILVLGVFTGKEEDLDAEKYIYGKDFIYTKNTEKFADIVGIFLKRVIESG